ncbi:hypothetical protein ES708_05403 [subsurface metagenome]
MQLICIVITAFYVIGFSLESKGISKTMAKITIKVDPRTGVTYFPREIRKEGFVGQIEGLPNALTFTLIKPGTKLADVAKSLDIILQDIALRIKQGQE